MTQEKPPPEPAQAAPGYRLACLGRVDPLHLGEDLRQRVAAGRLASR
jgi:hypothetical protein